MPADLSAPHTHTHAGLMRSRRSSLACWLTAGHSACNNKGNGARPGRCKLAPVRPPASQQEYVSCFMRRTFNSIQRFHLGPRLYLEQRPALASVGGTLRGEESENIFPFSFLRQLPLPPPPPPLADDDARSLNYHWRRQYHWCCRRRWCRRRRRASRGGARF